MFTPTYLNVYLRTKLSFYAFGSSFFNLNVLSVFFQLQLLFNALFPTFMMFINVYLCQPASQPASLLPLLTFVVPPHLYSFLKPAANLVAFTGVTNAHGLSPQPTACRSPSFSLKTATGSNQAYSNLAWEVWGRWGSKSGANISRPVASPVLPMVI